MEEKFDVIVFATGYKSVANKWLKVYVIIKIRGGEIDHLPIYINIHLTFHICSIFFFPWTLFLMLFLIVN
jgi:hypothetical protein